MIKKSKSLLGATTAVLSVLVSCDAVARATSLSDLYQAAQNHPSVAVAKSEQEVARYDLDAAEWERFPSFSAEGARPFNTDNSLTLSVEQPLFTAGRIDALIDSKSAALEESEAKISDAELSIKLEVGTAFVEMLRAQRKIQDAEDNIRELEKLHAVIARRVEGEVSAKAEEVLVYARLQQAISERHQYKGQLESFRARIESATSLNVDKAANISCEIPQGTSEAELIDAAFSASPAIARNSFSRTAANADVRVAESEKWPKLVVAAEHVSDGDFGSGAAFSTYLGFRYQIQSGLSVNSRIAAARSKLMVVNENERVIKEQLVQQVSQYVQEYVAARNQIEPLESLVRSNDGLIESYLRQYRAGKKSWLDVVNAQRERVQSRLLLTDSQATQCLNAVRLELLTGQAFVKEQI